MKRIVILGVRRWVVIATALCIVACFAGAATAYWHNQPVTVVQAPPPPVPQTPPCEDKAVVKYGTEAWEQCDSRARLEVFNTSGPQWFLFKCICVRN